MQGRLRLSLQPACVRSARPLRRGLHRGRLDGGVMAQDAGTVVGSGGGAGRGRLRFGLTGTAGGPAQQVVLGREAERAGWDGFFTWDAISIGEWKTWAPWAILAAVAQATERLTLGAVVFAPGRRLPWEVARDVLTLDHLSAGRLVVPVGLGVSDDAAFSRVRGQGASARDRARLLDECLDFLDRAFTGETFTFEGADRAITDVQFRPLPVQRPRPPVWVVGAWPSDRSMGRAARKDGVLLQRLGGGDPLTPSDVADAVAWVRQRRAELAASGEVTAPDEFDVVLDGTLPTDPAARADRVAALAEA